MIVATERSLVRPPLLEMVAELATDETGRQARPFLVPCGEVRRRSPRAEVSHRPVVIVEPHADDAVLSLGGLLLTLESPIQIVTVFSESDTAHPQVRPLLERLHLSPRELRRSESQAAAAALGASWVELGFRESALARSECVHSQKPPRDLCETLRDIVPPEALVLLPAGFGGHPDHVAVTRCEEAFPLCALYEDVAPISAYSRCTEDFWIRYSELSATHVPLYVPIDDVLDSKVEVAGLYRSQFSPLQARGLARYACAVGRSAWHLAHDAPPGDAYERLYVRSERSTAIRRRLWPTGSRDQLPEPSSPSQMPLPEVILGASGSSWPASIKALFHERRTRRDLTGAVLALEDLSAVLDLAVRRLPIGGAVPHFPYPTAGGLGSCGVSILPWNVSGLSPVVHRYEASGHRLLPSREPLPLRTRLFDHLGRQDWTLGASLGLLIEADGGEAVARYGPGAWQLLLLEAGHLAQTLQMALCTRGISCVLLPAFDKPGFERISPGRRSLALVLASPAVAELPLPLFREAPSWQDDPFSAACEGRTPLCELDLECRTFDILGGRYLLSRCRIPTTSFSSTGWAVAMADDESGIGAAENLARLRAVAEAREVLVARTASGAAIVRATAGELGDVVVEAATILPDSRQWRAREAGKTRTRPAAKPRHWLRGVDLVSRKPVWLPTDAVLMDRRFFAGELLPTSTGLACRPSFGEALGHGFREVMEKVVGPYLSLEWRRGEPEDAVGKSLAAELVARGQELEIQDMELAGLYLCRAISRPLRAAGGAAHWSASEALTAALGECLAQILDGVGEAVETLPATAREGAEANTSGEDLGSLLEFAGLRLAAVQIEPIDGDAWPLPDWPVVKVVAWRS